MGKENCLAFPTPSPAARGPPLPPSRLRGRDLSTPPSAGRSPGDRQADPGWWRPAPGSGCVALGPQFLAHQLVARTIFPGQGDEQGFDRARIAKPPQRLDRCLAHRLFWIIEQGQQGGKRLSSLLATTQNAGDRLLAHLAAWIGQSSQQGRERDGGGLHEMLFPPGFLTISHTLFSATAPVLASKQDYRLVQIVSRRRERAIGPGEVLEDTCAFRPRQQSPSRTIYAGEPNWLSCALVPPLRRSLRAIPKGIWLSQPMAPF